MESGNRRGDLRSSCYIFVWPFWSKQGSEQSALGVPSKGLGEQQNRALEDHSWLLITQPRAGPQIQGVKILDLVHGWLLDPRGHQQPAWVTNYTRADCIHRLPVHPAEAGLELFTWRRGEEKGNILLGLLGWAWHARLLCLFHRGFQRPGMCQECGGSPGPCPAHANQSVLRQKPWIRCLRSAPVFQEFLWNQSHFLHGAKRD